MEDFGTILTLLIAVLAAGAGVVEKMLKKAGKKMPDAQIPEEKSFEEFPSGPEGNFSLENAAPAEKKETVPAEEVQPSQAFQQPVVHETDQKEKFIDKKKLIIYSEILNRKY